MKNLNLDDRAWLVSEVFTPDAATKATCFTWWYHAYGSTVGALRVFLADANATSRVMLWELRGQQSLNSTDWKQGILPITNINSDYTILIEGTVGVGTSTYYSDIR